ncbi:MAG: hypothetical protein AAF242_08810 [Bacteroidota bacterium]
MQTIQFYEPSRQVNPLSFGITLLIGIVAMLVLGYIYSILIIFIPIIYANVLITIGFGLAIAYLIKILGKLFHNRHKQSLLAQAVILGLLANLFQWITYVLYMYIGEYPSPLDYLANIPVFINPLNLFPLITEINAVGTWSIFGITFSGGLLALVWIIEFLMILGIPVLMILGTTIPPYSELSKKWYPQFILDKDFTSMVAGEELLKQLSTGTLNTLQGFKEGGATRFSKISLYYLPNEMDQYLSIDRYFIEDQGKGKTEQTAIVENLKIKAVEAKAILDHFKYQKLSFSIL